MRVMVTGASRGIGRATCLRVARDAAARDAGVRIAACASAHPDELETLAEELRGLDAEVLPLVGDISDAEVPARLVGEAVAAFGGLDALVCNAGIGPPGTLLEQSLEDWGRLFDVNLRATWLLARAAHPSLAAARGCIVTLGSMSGVEPQPGMGGYSVTKAGVIMLTRLMAQEWAADGIRVNCVSPGMVLTPMTEAAYRDADFKRARESMVPAGRIADPSDIATAIAFLISPGAAYVTGHNLVADGGMTDAVLRLLPVRKHA